MKINFKNKKAIVELDKRCGFYGRRAEFHKPYLLGSLTPLHKLEMMNAKEFLAKLARRLEASKIVKRSKLGII